MAPLSLSTIESHIAVRAWSFRVPVDSDGGKQFFWFRFKLEGDGRGASYFEEPVRRYRI
jgi:hypothetical protein